MRHSVTWLFVISDTKFSNIYKYLRHNLQCWNLCLYLVVVYLLISYNLEFCTTPTFPALRKWVVYWSFRNSPPVALLILNHSPPSRVLLQVQFRYYLTEIHSSVAEFLQCIWQILSSNPGEIPAKLTFFSPLCKGRGSATKYTTAAYLHVLLKSLLTH